MDQRNSRPLFPHDNVTLPPNAEAHVNAYVDYKRIVGDDDGGKPFTPEEYRDYVKNVVPKRMRNRLYVSWQNSNNMDCILIGPETLCFCQHRYKQHQTDFEVLPTERPIRLPCKQTRCGCISYAYVPKNASHAIRCQCKHLSTDHHETEPYRCTQSGCRCSSFHSSFTCNCGEPTHMHNTVVQTKEEREADGKPVGHPVPMQAMGGITGFSSLAEGYMRRDPSGIGYMSEEQLNAPITAADHPFLRQYASQLELGTTDHMLKQPGESDMDFYERQYQARKKLQMAQSRGVSASQRGSGSISSRGLHNSKGGRGKKS